MLSSNCGRGRTGSRTRRQTNRRVGAEKLFMQVTLANPPSVSLVHAATVFQSLSISSSSTVACYPKSEPEHWRSKDVPLDACMHSRFGLPRCGVGSEATGKAIGFIGRRWVQGIVRELESLPAFSILPFIFLTEVLKGPNFCWGIRLRLPVALFLQNHTSLVRL